MTLRRLGSQEGFDPVNKSQRPQPITEPGNEPAVTDSGVPELPFGEAVGGAEIFDAGEKRAAEAHTSGQCGIFPGVTRDFSRIASKAATGKTPGMDDTSFGDYLKVEMERRGLNPSSLATRSGLKPDAVRDFFRGKASVPRLDTAVALAKGLEIRVSDLVEGHQAFVAGNPPPYVQPVKSELKAQPEAPGGDGVEYLGQAYAPLPVYDVMVSAGPGSFNRDHPIPETYTLLSLDRLKAVTKARIEDLAMVRVSGDSMSPTLMHNDEILVDTSIAKVGRDGMYVVATGEEVQVKRIAWDWATKSLIVASDNHLYPTSRGVQEDDIMILGRVVWISRNVGG